MFAFDGIAFENLENNSVCIIDDGFIMKIRRLDDIQRNLVVFVSDPDEYKTDIKRGDRVRVFKLGQFL